MKYLDLTGLQRFWNKIKTHVQTSLQGYAKSADLATVATSGSYNDLTDKPETPSGNSTPPTYSEGLTYQLTTDKTGYAVTNIGTCTDTDIIIPPIYNGLPVKEIFGWSNTTIISVTLPNSIISMGNYVFKGCSNLIKIIIPDSVTTIGQDIFNECPNVTVYCEAKSKPEGWHSRWDMSARHVVWNAFDFIGVHEHIENDLSEYVTEAELEEKGYLTETKLDAKGYATEEYVDEKVSSMSGNGGGTSSGDSSIYDLGEQPDHKDAQQAIVDHLMQMNADDGCYLFKYYCTCRGNACFAVVKLVNDEVITIWGTVYDNYRSFRQFHYTSDDGFTFDGCWKEIGSSDYIPFTDFTCHSPSRTVRELIDQLANEDVDTADSITVIVTFSAMLSGTFLCDISHYYGDYYGCKFTDLTNLKTYYFEGESRSLSLYDNLSNGGTSSGGTGLSMPRIRLSNWKYITPASRYEDEYGSEIWNGEIKFSVCVQDGTVQEGDELEICALRKTYGKYKLRRFGNRAITSEDIENLDKQPFLQFTVNNQNLKYIFRTDSGSPQKAKPKYIRIRRPIWGENINGEWVVVNALFSNVVPVEIGLKYEDITEYQEEY